jgi:hypothetical protein
MPPDESGSSCATDDEMKRARSAVKTAGAVAVELTDKIERTVGGISIGTTQRAKRSEFRAVAVMACDDEPIR